MAAPEMIRNPFRLPVVLASTVLAVMLAAPAPADTPCSPGGSISYQFNGTPIAQGNYIWFDSVLKASGVSPTQTETIHFTNQTITFKANNVPYSLSVPDATVTYCPSCTPATTTFSGSWMTSVPSSGLSGNQFLSGLAFKVPSGGFPGGIKSVTWSGTFSSSLSGVKIQWQWGAAVYTSFDGSMVNLGVKPVDDNKNSVYKNSDHAGTPENYKTFVIGGSTGGGGANYTGSLSSTQSESCN